MSPAQIAESEEGGMMEWKSVETPPEKNGPVDLKAGIFSHEEADGTMVYVEKEGPGIYSDGVWFWDEGTRGGEQMISNTMFPTAWRPKSTESERDD